MRTRLIPDRRFVYNRGAGEEEELGHCSLWGVDVPGAQPAGGVPASRADMPAIAASIPALTRDVHVGGSSDTVSSVPFAARGSKSVVSSVDAASGSRGAAMPGVEPLTVATPAPPAAN